MKKIIIGFLLLSNVLFLLAQNAVELQRKVANSDFVFEGKVLRTNGFWNEKHTFIYTSNLVEVYKVFKGESVSTTVEIITRGGEVDDKILIITHNTELTPHQEGIFFAKTQDLEGKKRVFCVNDPISYEKGLYSQLEKMVGTKFKAIGFTERQQDIQKWVKEQTGISIYNTLSTDVGYEFANPVVTGWNTGQPYLEFDIKLSTFSSTYKYGGGEIYLDYDIAAFGSNIAANGNITATKGTATTSPDYTLTLSDSTGSKLRIALECVNSPINLYDITTTSEQLCHVKFSIANLISIPNIGFDEDAMQGHTQYYDNGTFVDFPIVWVVDGAITGSWQTMIAASIVDFYPASIPAGTFQPLTIIGNDFGYTQGAVKFRNVDQLANTNYYIIAPPSAIVSWKGDTISATPDTIVVYVPTSTAAGNKIAGTGRIVVEKAGGIGIDTSTQVLDIPYAVRTSWEVSSGEMFKMVLPDKFNGGYNIQLSSSFDTISPYVSIYLDSTILKWQCATGINWQRGANSSLDISPNTTKDGINLIYSKSFGTDSTTAAETFMVGSKVSSCYGTTTPYPQVAYYLEEFDIAFNSNVLWRYDPNIPMAAKENDYFSTTLHEFGHAHQVAHCADTSKVMQPFNFQYYINSTLKAEDITGGLAARTQSIGVITNPNIQCNFLNNMNWLTPSTTGQCTGVNSTQNELDEHSSMQIFPNPYNDYTTINYHLTKKTSINLTVIDLQGRVLFVKNVDNQKEGEHEIELNIPISSGVYFVVLRTENGLIYNKIIKQ